jgi:hypothetical protein
MNMKALKYVGPKTRSFRSVSAILFSFLALVVVMGAAQASGPPRPQPQSPWRQWWGGGCYCLPWQPVPLIHILDVVKNESVTFETEDFPKNEDFTVTMGYMHTKGVDGIVIGTFNTGEDETGIYTFAIPEDLADLYQIAVRAETDHACPYNAYNWFYNNNSEIEPEIDDNL